MKIFNLIFLNHESIGFSIAVIYGLCSTSMAFINKAILTSFKFNYPFFLVAIQMIFTISILEFLRLNGNKYIVKFTLQRAFLFLAPSIFYAANSVLSLSALSGMNIPMYGILKRCSPVFILLLGMVILRKPLPEFKVIVSVIMITGGCVIAGYGDISHDLKAYFYGLSSVVSQSLYLLLVQKGASDFGAIESLHLNSFNTLPPLLLFSLLSGEFSKASSSFYFYFSTLNLPFLGTFSLLIILSSLLNFLLFLCTTYNSALTTSITGTLKTILQTVIGFFTFGGVKVNFLLLLGIFLNIFGGIIYTWIKHQRVLQHSPSSLPIKVNLPNSIENEFNKNEFNNDYKINDINENIVKFEIKVDE